jgi:sugar phosphate isomerase/epimerase
VVTSPSTTPPVLIATCWMHAGPTEPFVGRMWSPWSLRSRVRELARVGFTGIGLFHDDLAHVLEEEALGGTVEDRLRWVRTLLEDHGITTVELEFLTQWMLPADDPRRRAEQPVRELLFTAAEQLRARHVKVGNLGIPVEPAALQERFSALCADAAAVGTVVALEILPPDPTVRSMADALALTRPNPNSGLFFDTWHINNITHITYDEIAALRTSDIAGCELDDGLAFDEEDAAALRRPGAPDFIALTCNTRRIPGEGDYDVVGFVQALRAAGFDGPWGNEILSEEYRRLPKEIAFRRVHRATSRLLLESGSNGSR